MKRILILLLAVISVLSMTLVSCTSATTEAGTDASTGSQTADESTQEAEKLDINIAVLKGPTGMGAAYLMSEAEASNTLHNYNFTIESAPDAVTAGIVKGSYDIAAVPTNLAAVLNSKDGVDVRVIAVNTLGTLYLLEKGETVNSLADLAGKSIVASGEGTAADAVLSRLIASLDDPSSVTVHYASEHSEAVALAASGEYDIAVLPEPHVTSLMKKDAGFRIALDLTQQWEGAGYGQLVMGALICTKAFLEEHPEAVDQFIQDYAKSANYVNTNIPEASQLIEKYGIAAAAVAEAAIPNCNIVCLTGQEMKTALNSFYTQLNEFKPALIGGAIPADELYYVK